MARTGTLFGLDNLPYGVFSVGGDRRGSAYGWATRWWTLAWSPGRGRPLGAVERRRSTRSWRSGPRSGQRSGTGCRAARGRVARDAVEPLLLAARRRHHAPAVRGGRLRRLLLLAAARHQRRAHLPARRRAAQRPTGGTCRSATTVAPGRWSSPARTSSARGASARARRDSAATARADGSTSRPSSASWSAARPRSATRSATADFARPRLRGDAAERLVGARHPGLGVRAAGAVPRQVVRDLDQRRGSRRWRRWRQPESPCRARTPSRWTTCGCAEPAGYDIAFEVVLNGEVVSRPPYAAMYWSPAQMLAHLTVNGASLRTGDLFAQRHDQRRRARPARLAPRAQLGRQGAVRRRARRSSRTATS